MCNRLVFLIKRSTHREFHHLYRRFGRGRGGCVVVLRDALRSTQLDVLIAALEEQDAAARGEHNRAVEDQLHAGSDEEIRIDARRREREAAELRGRVAHKLEEAQREKQVSTTLIRQARAQESAMVPCSVTAPQRP